MENVDRDFEALWTRAIEFKQDMPTGKLRMQAEQVPDALLPQGLLQGLGRISERCHEQGLLNDEQLTTLRHCMKEQQAIFDSIASARLRDAMASLQAD